MAALMKGETIQGSAGKVQRRATWKIRAFTTATYEETRKRRADKTSLKKL